MEKFEKEIAEIAAFALARGYSAADLLSDKITEITKAWYLSNRATYDKLAALSQTEQKQVLKIK